MCFSKLIITLAGHSSLQQFVVPSLVTPAQNDILKISEFIEAGRPMFELPRLEYLTGAYGEDASNGETSSSLLKYFHSS
jgi:hypothetical protein